MVSGGVGEVPISSFLRVCFCSFAHVDKHAGAGESEVPQGRVPDGVHQLLGAHSHGPVRGL